MCHPLFNNIKLSVFRKRKDSVYIRASNIIFTFQPTNDALCTRLSRVQYLLRGLTSHAFFQAHFSYGTIIWGHSPNVRKTFLLQEKAVRLLSNAECLDICKPVLVNNEILTVAYIVYTRML